MGPWKCDKDYSTNWAQSHCRKPEFSVVKKKSGCGLFFAYKCYMCCADPEHADPHFDFLLDYSYRPSLLEEVAQIKNGEFAAVSFAGAVTALVTIALVIAR